MSKLKEEKRAEKLNKAKAAWGKLQENISLLTRKGQEYLSKYTPPAPAPPSNPTQTPSQVHTRSTPLKGLNLPTFSGNKADYLRFKKEFEKHVKYETEDEKLMALKTECLSKAADKRKISNESTLEDCFKKLDQAYGDVHTLVAEIFSNWTNLRPPKTDTEFIKFMEQIEYGVSTLKAVV